jgi:hypothetical protein
VVVGQVASSQWQDAPATPRACALRRALELGLLTKGEAPQGASVAWIRTARAPKDAMRARRYTVTSVRRVLNRIQDATSQGQQRATRPRCDRRR